MTIDMWYGHGCSEVDGVDIYFNDLDCKFRGNLYKGNKVIGDYTCESAMQIAKCFPNLKAIKD